MTAFPFIQLAKGIANRIIIERMETCNRVNINNLPEYAFYVNHE